MNPNLVMWEAVYKDGCVVRESERHYSKLTRASLNQFRLIYNGQVLQAFDIPDGERLVYRRSVLQSSLGKPETHLFLVGSMPGGPASAFNPHTGEMVSDDRGFHPLNHTCWQSDLRTCVWLQSPVPHPWEGEKVW